MKIIQQQHCAATCIIRIPSIHILCAVIAEVDLLMMSTFTIVKTQTSMKEILKAILALLIQKDNNLVGVANMTQRTSNHAICAAGVEVEFHG